MKKSDYLFWGLCLVVVVWFAGQRIARSRAAKAWEAERQERIAKDFNKSYDEVSAAISGRPARTSSASTRPAKASRRRRRP